jgi:hypothetical protein
MLAPKPAKVNKGARNLVPIRDSERARELGRLGAQARIRKQEEAKAALAMVRAAERGESMGEHGQAVPVQHGPMRLALVRLSKALADSPPWKEGPEAAQLLRAVAELAAQEDRDAEARRQRLLADAVRKEAPTGPSPDAVAALAKVLGSLPPPVGASQADAGADSAGAGADA